MATELIDAPAHELFDTASLAIPGRAPIWSPAKSRWIVAISPSTLLVLLVLCAIWCWIGLNPAGHSQSGYVLATGRDRHVKSVWNPADSSVGPWQASLLYWAYVHYGPYGFALLRAAAPMSFFVLAATACGLKTRTNARRCVIGMLSAAAISASLISDVSGAWWGASALLCVVYVDQLSGGTAAASVLLSLLFLLWSNVHASFPVGLIYLSTQAALSLDNPTNYRRRLTLASAAALGSGIHVLGPTDYLHCWQGLLSTTAEFTHTGAASIAFFASLASALFIVPSLRRSIAKELAPLAAITAFQVLIHPDWTPLWSCCWVVFAWSRTDAPVVGAPAASRSIVRTLLGVAALVAALAWSPLSRQAATGGHVNDVAFIQHSPARYLLSSIDSGDVRGVAFCPPAWAGEASLHFANAAIWPNRAGETESSMRDYRALENGHFRWREIAEYHHVRYFIVDKIQQASLWTTISASEYCKVIYEDQSAGLVELLPDQAHEEHVNQQPTMHVNTAYNNTKTTLTARLITLTCERVRATAAQSAARSNHLCNKHLRRKCADGNVFNEYLARLLLNRSCDV